MTSSGSGLLQSSDRTALIWISTFTVTHHWSHAHGRPRALLTKHLIRLNEHLRGPAVEHGDVLKGFTAASLNVSQQTLPRSGSLRCADSTGKPAIIFSNTWTLRACVRARGCVRVCEGVSCAPSYDLFFLHTSL